MARHDDAAYKNAARVYLDGNFFYVLHEMSMVIVREDCYYQPPNSCLALTKEEKHRSVKE